MDLGDILVFMFVASIIGSCALSDFTTSHDDCIELCGKGLVKSHQYFPGKCVCKNGEMSKKVDFKTDVRTAVTELKKIFKDEESEPTPTPKPKYRQW